MTVQEEAKAYKKFRNEEALEYCRKQAMLEQVVGNENWKHYNTAAEALEEVEQYRALGTVEELKEAREKQILKKPIEDNTSYSGYKCPTCNSNIYQLRSHNIMQTPHCIFCGQALKWGEEE